MGCTHGRNVKYRTFASRGRSFLRFLSLQTHASFHHVLRLYLGSRMERTIRSKWKGTSFVRHASILDRSSRDHVKRTQEGVEGNEGNLKKKRRSRKDKELEFIFRKRERVSDAFRGSLRSSWEDIRDEKWNEVLSLWKETIPRREAVRLERDHILEPRASRQA